MKTITKLNNEEVQITETVTTSQVKKKLELERNKSDIEGEIAAKETSRTEQLADINELLAVFNK